MSKHLLKKLLNIHTTTDTEKNYTEKNYTKSDISDNLSDISSNLLKSYAKSKYKNIKQQPILKNNSKSPSKNDSSESESESESESFYKIQ